MSRKRNPSSATALLMAIAMGGMMHLPASAMDMAEPDEPEEPKQKTEKDFERMAAAEEKRARKAAKRRKDAGSET